MNCFLSSISKVCLLCTHDDDFLAFYSKWLRQRYFHDELYVAVLEIGVVKK